MFRDPMWDEQARKVSALAWTAKREADAALRAEELLAKQCQVLNTSNASKLTSIEEAVTNIEGKIDQLIAGSDQLQEKYNITASHHHHHHHGFCLRIKFNRQGECMWSAL